MIAALVLGGVVGAVFGLFRLPVPAPAAIEGLLGIAGLYFGYQAAVWVVTYFGH